jgi:hypothetical protein
MKQIMNVKKLWIKLLNYIEKINTEKNLVKDIEKVIGHPDPSPRAKEYLKRCLILVKEK